MKRRAKALPLGVAFVAIGERSFAIALGSVVEFTHRGMQGMCRGSVIGLRSLVSGAVSVRLLLTHWNDGSGWKRNSGSHAIWAGTKVITKVL